jgi:hypothetical protein
VHKNQQVLRHHTSGEGRQVRIVNYRNELLVSVGQVKEPGMYGQRAVHQVLRDHTSGESSQVRLVNYRNEIKVSLGQVKEGMYVRSKGSATSSTTSYVRRRQTTTETSFKLVEV